MYQQLVNWLEAHQLPCLFKKIFHVACPGCGLQRSFVALLRGSLLKSLQLYPALLLILFFFGYLLINKLNHYRFSTKITNAGIACISVTILASYIYKIVSN